MTEEEYPEWIKKCGNCINFDWDKFIYRYKLSTSICKKGKSTNQFIKPQDTECMYDWELDSEAMINGWNT